MSAEREVVEAFLAHIKSTPRLYVGRVLNSGASIPVGGPELDELVDAFMEARFRAALDAHEQKFGR